MTLHTFGCSFTEEFTNTSEDSKQNKFVREFLNGQYPDAWPTVLSKLIGYKVQNFGQGGSSNYQIFDMICSNCNKFTENDIIIVGWTNHNRFRWARENGKGWYHVTPMNIIKDNNLEYIDKKTLTDILINREHHVYVEEIYKYEKILDELSKSKGFHVYYWAMDNLIINSLPKNELLNKKYLCTEMFHEKGDCVHRYVMQSGGGTIEKETNGVIQDTHMGVTGHQIQAEFFYNHLKKYHTFNN